MNNMQHQKEHKQKMPMTMQKEKEHPMTEKEVQAMVKKIHDKK